MQLDTIVVGDCLDVMREMPDGCVDLVVADPPYNPKSRSKDNGSHVDLDKGDYHEWCKNWLVELIRIAKTVLITPGTANLTNWLKDKDITPTWIHMWYRPNSMNRHRATWINVWEPILRFGGKWRHYHDSLNLAIVPQKDLYWHPCPKQLKAIEWMITGGSDKGESVFDPFMGSGTTAVAALKLGRHFYGCDINPEYVRLANERIEKTRLEMSQMELAL